MRPRATGMVLACAALLTLAACGERGADGTTAVADGGRIVELERQFAAASRARGARAAFLEFLAEDSIILQPGPVWGRAAWEVADDLPGTLDWAPDRAQLSADGRFGYASGRWTLTPAEGTATVEGRYVTVWRDTGAGWRVIFDGGFGRAATAGQATHQPARLDEAHCTSDPAAQPGDLQALDLALSGAADGATHGERLGRHAVAELVLFHPPDAEGAEGTQAVAAALAALAPATQLLPMGAGLAGSGELGYTYGLSAPASDASADAAYVHLWCRHAEGWRVLLELRGRLPLPAAAAGAGSP